MKKILILENISTRFIEALIEILKINHAIHFPLLQYIQYRYKFNSPVH